MERNIKIVPVVYMGGTCGDLVSAMLDLTDVSFDLLRRKMQMPIERQRLKKPFTFSNDQEKNQYLADIAKLYTSVPSHDLDYHVQHAQWFIGIRVRDPDIALWAADRFRYAHRPQVWQTVKQGWHIDTIEQYAQLLMDYGNLISQYTTNLLNLEDIVSGHLIPCLEHIVGRKLDKNAVNCYRNWQDIQNGTFST